MYIAKIFKKEVKLSDKDFKLILKKYDIVNAVLNLNLWPGKWEIRVHCPLCVKFGNCEFCPFGVFSTKKNVCGCYNLVYKLLGKHQEIHEPTTFVNSIENAINIEKIHRFLLKKFKKVESKIPNCSKTPRNKFYGNTNMRRRLEPL